MFRIFGWIDVYNLLLATQWTIYLSIIALVGGTIAGLIIALLRTSSLLPLRFVTMRYIRLFQGTPFVNAAFFGLFWLGDFRFSN